MGCKTETRHRLVATVQQNLFRNMSILPKWCPINPNWDRAVIKESILWIWYVADTGPFLPIIANQKRLIIRAKMESKIFMYVQITSSSPDFVEVELWKVSLDMIFIIELLSVPCSTSRNRTKFNRKIRNFMTLPLTSVSMSYGLSKNLHVNTCVQLCQMRKYLLSTRREDREKRYVLGANQRQSVI